MKLTGKLFEFTRRIFDIRTTGFLSLRWISYFSFTADLRTLAFLFHLI